MSDKDEILAAVADGFVAMQNHVDDRFDQLDQKIENRTDLLEGIMRVDLAKERERVQMLEVRVAKLEAAFANS